VPTIASNSGSAISARTITPSLHLAKLVDLLANSIEYSAASSDQLPFIHCSNGRIVINTGEVIQRLTANPKFKSEFEPGTNTGFVRDIELPPFGSDARVGGRLLAGSQQALTEAVNRLVNAIEWHINHSVPADLLSKLTEHSVEETIRAIAAKFRIRAPLAPNSARLTPVAFSSEKRMVKEKTTDVARMFSAIETSTGGGDIERFIKGISKFLQKQDFDEDNIAAIAQSLRLRAEKPGERINRFLQFMEDEAHSRVRMQIAMQLMAAISNQSKKPGFKAYVLRVLECFEKFAGPRGSSLYLDVSAGFGESSNVNLADLLRRAGFYNCLPVWPEWAVQMFEARPNPTSNRGVIVRDVTYRFRVNGSNPESGKPPFDARIEKHVQKLEAFVVDVRGNSARGDQSVARQVAELVFLWLVVPDSIDNPTEFDVVARANDIAGQLKSDPVATLEKIIADLRARSPVMRKIAFELIAIIKNRAHNVLSATNATTGKLLVSVSREIIDREAFDSYTDDSEILSRSSGKHDHIEWLKHLTVGKDVIPPNSLFSFVVETKLQERSLTVHGTPRVVAMKPDLSERVLPIRLAPYRKVSQHGWEPAAGTVGALDPGFGIEVQYNDKTQAQDKRSKDNGSDQARKDQIKAAAISAFAVLVYVTLWLLMRRIRAVRPGFSTMLLRVAKQGRSNNPEDDRNSQSTLLYAVSHALEKVLTREGNVKLQGYAANGDVDLEKYRKSGAVAALASGQVLSFNLEGSLDRVALVTYFTRPCDTHPMSLEPDLFLFICRTYVAERKGSDAQIKVARMRHQIIGSRDDFGEAQPVLTELSWLKEQGYEHVMLLSHHFGNRHLGRAAERHAPHGSREFLDKAHQEFPEMRFYTLRRDVFPATRLRRRADGESAFEVLTFADHTQLYEQNARDLMRGIMPIYTFATLSVVGDDSGRPQSGFCTYFFDVEHRITDMAWQEATKADILGFGGDGSVRASLISVLRAVHFLESERQTHRQDSSIFLPVLDPYDWVAPIQRAHAGEIVIMESPRKGSVILSLPAMLSHITGVLKLRFPEKEAQS